MREAGIVVVPRAPLTKANRGGQPFDMTGARQVGHVLTEGRRRGAGHAVASMCVAVGMGASGPFEICRW